ncbi:zonular occludens toxin [Aquabacterium fontiphilum]|uniref:zonular occludens toxin domain-containing protein n=1 Tax=Aquabacterium fontiphilum TaxID=450365 RepID=UPI0013780C0B|nr:zonular occludens toxin domain-containing protein [Aquabacterium fontiphilum]NBD21953.1 zonular occludens toxin [Aquabacterium fontiphilum]
MINLLLGAPGGGKSYEANVFHILEALKKGRKVITNLPVNVDAYADIDPDFRDLLEIRIRPQPIRGTFDAARETGAFELFEDGHTELPPPNARVFGNVWDYWSDWRHAETGAGPLIVIDECHLCLPRMRTPQDVEEWYSLHRHFGVDVLLLTQSHGKISAAVRDLVQIVYRVRKNVALGSTSSYTRKTIDGIRGAEVGQSIRTYKPQYFKLYRSHTQGGAVSEFNASDVRPIWRHWSVYGFGIFMCVFFWMLATGRFSAPWAAKAPHVQQVQHHDPAPSPPPVRPARVVHTDPAQVKPADDVAEPFSGRGLHLTGYIKAAGRERWTFALSQNGQMIASLTDADLTDAGYTWRGLSHCAGEATYGTRKRVVICDAPQVGIGAGQQGGPRLRGVPADPDPQADNAAQPVT